MDDAQVAVWNNEGLPNDRMSAENAMILTNSERWPLMIDPQVSFHQSVMGDSQERTFLRGIPKIGPRPNSMVNIT